SVPQALRSLRRHPAVLGITLLSLVFFGIYGPVEVALPVYVAQSLRAGPGLLGGYFTLFAVGATAGALGATSLQRFGLWRVAIVVMVGWGLCLVPFGLVNSALVGFVALGVGGLIYGPFVPLKRTIIQRYSPRGSLTALAAASGLVTLPASPIGTALGGPIVAVLGPRSTLLASGLATILAAAVAAAVLTRRQARARQTDLGA
ncbi:MAG: MFS transporter, partial [Candidatus Dormibacteria bacterium]